MYFHRHNATTMFALEVCDVPRRSRRTSVRTGSLHISTGRAAHVLGGLEKPGRLCSREHPQQYTNAIHEIALDLGTATVKLHIRNSCQPAARFRQDDAARRMSVRLRNLTATTTSASGNNEKSRRPGTG